MSKIHTAAKLYDILFSVFCRYKCAVTAQQSLRELSNNQRNGARRKWASPPAQSRGRNYRNSTAGPCLIYANTNFWINYHYHPVWDTSCVEFPFPEVIFDGSLYFDHVKSFVNNCYNYLIWKNRRNKYTY